MRNLEESLKKQKKIGGVEEQILKTLFIANEFHSGSLFSKRQLFPRKEKKSSIETTIRKEEDLMEWK